MTNEEKAEEIAEQYEMSYNNTCDLLWIDLEDIAMQAMKWKDEQHAREKQKLINEACDWLFKNDSYAIPTNVQVDRLREYLNNIK